MNVIHVTNLTVEYIIVQYCIEYLLSFSKFRVSFVTVKRTSTFVFTYCVINSHLTIIPIRLQRHELQEGQIYCTTTTVATKYYYSANCALLICLLLSCTVQVLNISIHECGTTVQTDIADLDSSNHANIYGSNIAI